jgi:iron complex outermembrane receptor protein
MKKVFIICLLLATHTMINAQGFLSGKISDKVTGEAIAGATIYFPELKIGDISDENGLYKLHDLPKIITSVQVSFLSYKSVFEKVDLARTTLLNFELDPSITEMNEVVITGTSKATEISVNPIPVITLTNKKLQQNLSTNIIDAICLLSIIGSMSQTVCSRGEKLKMPEPAIYLSRRFVPEYPHYRNHVKEPEDHTDERRENYE